MAAPVTSPADPPEWERIEEEIRCPLCEYNLRELTEPRCPECGYRFRWPELIDPSQRLHPFLFEHHPERNLWSFRRTVVGGLRPLRFWGSLHPAQPLRLTRLMLYWGAMVGVVLVAPSLHLASGVLLIRSQHQVQRTIVQRYWSAPGVWSAPMNAASAAETEAEYGSTDAFLDLYYPLNGLTIARRLLSQRWVQGLLVAFVLTPVVWPWMTMLTLLLFAKSMKRKKIRAVHLMRCVVYSFDGILWVEVAASVFAVLNFGNLPTGRFAPTPITLGLFLSGTAVLLAIALALGAFRLALAYRLYLRFDHPVSTVLSSQVIVFLIFANLVVFVKYWIPLLLYV